MKGFSHLDPGVEKIRIDGAGITDLDELISELQRFPKLTALFLRNNNITKYSSLAPLKSLTILDLSGNPHPDDLQSFITCLRECPTLKCLYVDLASEEEEDDVITNLPQLHIINGLPLNEGDEDFVLKEPLGMDLVLDEEEEIEYEEYEEEEEMEENLIEEPDLGEGPPNPLPLSEPLTISQSNPPIRDEIQPPMQSQMHTEPSSSSITAHSDSSSQLILEPQEVQPRAQGVEMPDEMKDEELQMHVERNGWQMAEIERLRTKVKQLEMMLKMKKGSSAGAGSSSSASMVSSSSHGKLSSHAHASLEAGTPASIPTSAPATYGIPPSFASPTSTPLSSSSVRKKVLSLAQLKRFISELYVSKAKYDKRCMSSGLPVETMEQHLFTFLNIKYGMKRLITQWAQAVLEGVAKYEPTDNYVRVFSRVVHNEIDEEFVAVQRQVKDTVIELLRVYLRGKHPLVGEEQLKRLVNQRTGPRGEIREREWTDIIGYMYVGKEKQTAEGSEGDLSLKTELKNAAAQYRKEKEEARDQSAKKRTDTLKKLPKGRLLFSTFLEILLDNQLKGHCEFLRRFITLFRRFDTDSDGIVTEKDCESIMLSMDPGMSRARLLAALDALDPHGNKMITFNRCVCVLSDEIARYNDREEESINP
ncbi:hypothetical protein ADUPG1_011215 [Aduncisulcus paluster]|uniref:EF-hand domain-containing protein n=1 Tax=Aduncisulcus paluster TaxID=2918883 RepID=A0ABQ5JUS8_9EUKA|nr:hypothetical protein ADUPG1_011215 [Aduncisulcus paluster]